MGNVVELVRAVIEASRGVVPTWAWALAGAVLAAVAIPPILRNQRTDRARRAFRLASRLRGAEREAAEQAALQIVLGQPWGLVVIADLALAEGRRPLAEAALAELRQTRRLPAEIRRLTRILDGPVPGSALEAVIVVERLVEQGQLAEARSRLAAARRRWPDDVDLARAEAALPASPA